MRQSKQVMKRNNSKSKIFKKSPDKDRRRIEKEWTMAGLKNFWILLTTLFLLGACVPQTKQTECKSNEAFNAGLRSCVPIVGEPSSFINIDTFLPTNTLTKYKSDTSPITFSIVVSNPYNQTYSIQWQRIFNGVPISITPNTPTSYTMAPSLLSGEVGTHIISVKILNSSNAVVDSHSFELKINDNPKPVIKSATVTPSLYASSYTPLSPVQNFEFTINNNGASISASTGYRTDWRIFRAGVLIYSESDAFISYGLTSDNYASYLFNPLVLGIGGYTINARVTNSAGEVVGEQQWTATISHPALSKITNRDIYSSTQNPAFSAVSIAYNNVAYNGSTAYNFIPAHGVTYASTNPYTFIPGGVSNQGDYCVTVNSGEGTYVGDNKFVRVDFYLDGGTLIYSGLTTANDPKICLSENPAVLSSVVFSNSTDTTSQPHTLVARVVDEATAQEYATTDMNPSLGSYPVTWNFSVKPQNQVPVVDFGTMTGITCDTTATSTKSGCRVASDVNFTVNINLTSDDFYTVALNEANFNYSIRLYRDGVNIQTCTKTDPGYGAVADNTAALDVDGSNGYSCAFRIESYNGAGPLNLRNHTYHIQAEINDTGSPITATPATSRTLTWNFASSVITPSNPVPGVTETNTVPTISGWSIAGAVAEGAAINFSANITDAERDHHTYAVKYCPDAVCATPETLTSGTITRTSSTNPFALTGSFVLPEDFLLKLTGLDGHKVKRGETKDVKFFITVTDVPNTAIPLTASTILSNTLSTITNTNPLPTLTTAFSSPAPSTFSALTTFAFVGHPLSISNTPESILTDTSTVAAEKSFRYQWFIKNALMSDLQYEEIQGATGSNLIWTPSLIKDSNLLTFNPLSLILCVEDQPSSAVSSVNITESTCNKATPWVITVRNNIVVAKDLSTAPTSTNLASTDVDKGTETAIWYETPSTFNAVTSSAAYIAMIGNDDQKIHIKKVLVRDRGGIDTINATLIVSFNAVPSGTVDEVKDLSITGTTTELYVAYLASRTGSPGSYYPQVRRIDLTATPGKTQVAGADKNNHSGKFGFDYNGLRFTKSCTPINDCITTTGSGISTVEFNPSGADITGSFILRTPNGNFTVEFGTYDGIDTICSTCSGTTMANNLKTIINQSTDPLLAGYSASSVGNIVTINGAAQGDLFDASSDLNPRIADRMGKIYISGGSWYLPFINSSLGGGFNSKLSAYTGTTGANMSTIVESILEPTDSSGLANMDAAINFDNYLEGAYLWIAMVSKTGSAGKLYKVDPSTYSLIDSDNIFSDTALIDVQIAASVSNVFVGATAAVGSELLLGVYDNNGTVLDEFNINNSTNVGSATRAKFNKSYISSYRILPYGNEARIFAVSNNNTVNYNLYVARLRTVSSTWTLSCGDCKRVSELGSSLSQYVSLGVAPIRIRQNPNPSSLYRLASDGSVTGQGIKDVAFVSFGRIDSAATSCDPAIGVFNVEGEAIGSTSTYSGTSPNEDAGLYRTPFIKN